MRLIIMLAAKYTVCKVGSSISFKDTLLNNEMNSLTWKQYNF